MFRSREDLDFKRFYETRLKSLFASLECIKRDTQTKLYLSGASEEGIQNPDKGNINIRKELTKELLNGLDQLTEDLSQFLWIKINKMIDWIK